MKKLLFFLISLFFFSCAGKIVSPHDFPAIQGVYRPLDSLTLDSARHGYVSIDSSHAGNPQIFTMFKTVEPSWSQKWSIAKHNGTLWIGIMFVILAVFFAGLGFYFTINVPEKFKLAPVACGLLCVVMCWCFGGAVDWAHTKNADIPVWQYDQLMKESGNLDQFWSTHLYN